MTAASHIAGAKFSIRDYRPADFDTLWDIDQRCFPPGISYSQLELTSYIVRRHAITLVAEGLEREAPALDSPEHQETLQVVGFVVAHSIRHRYGRILTLDIVPEARRFGLGTQLMAACEERLRAAGCSEIFLETAVNNEPALRLYRKLGYEVIDVLPEYYASHSLDAFRMGKRL